MVRINLLPAEIIERRRYERFFPYVFITGAIILGVLVVVWGAVLFFISDRTAALQQTQESTQQLEQQAAQLQIFEQREAQLRARQDSASRAIFGRINMGRLAEEISLVLPDEVWFQRLFIDEEAGMTVNGYAPDTFEGDMADSYKSVAATLVRLNALELLYDVWLGRAQSSTFGDFQFDPEVEGEVEEARVVEFEATARIVRELPAPVAEPAPPAPPAE